MHRSHIPFFTALLFIVTSQVSQAAHYSGGSLTYECTGGNFYSINLDLLLDCSGTVLTAQNVAFTNDCGVNFTINGLPQIVNEEVSQLCAASVPNSTCNGGALPGLRRYRFQQTVYLSPCNDWTISWNVCCRNSSENLQGGPGMYLETTLNNAGGVCDRSPVIADQSNPLVCVNQPVLFNPGFNDPDGNVMAFELIGARFGLPLPNPVTYDPGFSGAAPIPGIALDPITGQLSFTPTVTGNYIVVLKVTSYNSSNAVIGTVMRDFIVTVVNCADLAPQTTGPVVGMGATLTGANELTVCDGVPFCLDLTFTDAGPSEVITLASNAAALLPGATFTRVGLNPVVGTLCWTPDLAHARTNVHFKATDRACPIPNVASTSILITVDETPNTLPNAGMDGTLGICPTDPPTNLSTGLGGAPEEGGTWTFEGVAHGPTYDVNVDEPGIYTYTVVGESPCATASASVTVTEGAGGLILEFQSGSTNPNTVTFEVLDETGSTTILGGNNPVPANSIGTTTLCLADGCYQLRVTDAGGDGLLGYILRESGANGRRVIDNRENMNDGISQISGGQTFCIPMSDDRPIFSSCDKLDWVSDKFIVATENVAVSEAYATPSLRNSSGYVFWFYDPNGTFSFRRFRKHSESDGYGTGALRANHFRINAWSNTPSSPHLPEGVLLNVRIKGRVAWSNDPWGPACQFKMDAVRAACPIVKLQDNPLADEYSCGVSRVFGGSNHWTNRLTANPPQPVPTVSSGDVRYQFRFRIPGEAVCIIRPMQTSPRMYMNWNGGDQLECNKQYEVDVRVSLDGGATWCIDGANPSCVEPVTPWGKVCMVNITNSPDCVNAQGGSTSMAAQQNGALTIYPNPNRGDQLFINLTEVDAEIVSVDMYDLSGKRVSSRTIAVADGFLNSMLELNNELANGMYMVNITAGEQVYIERLVVQK